MFSQLFKRQRELPFGAKLQNHGLNSRMNDEFKKFFSTWQFEPIMRNVTTNRYWINTNLLVLKVGRKSYNLAQSVIAIIDAYMDAKQESFNAFLRACHRMKDVMAASPAEVEEFIMEFPPRPVRLFRAHIGRNQKGASEAFQDRTDERQRRRH